MASCSTSSTKWLCLSSKLHARITSRRFFWTPRYGPRSSSALHSRHGDSSVPQAQIGELWPNDGLASVFASPDCRIHRRPALAFLLLALSSSDSVAGAAEMMPGILQRADEQQPSPFSLESYTDEAYGFTLMKPATWKKVEKAGATVLFEDPESKGNNIGVVVNPVRISSLTEFGTIDVVADKLLQAEKKKPSTNDVQLLKVIERQAHGGVPLYQLEYELDSSRGVKRILSAVTVAKKKLYILNVTVKDSSDMPLTSDTASLLKRIVNSFDLLN